MHAPQSPRPRTYLQRHGIKIIGVILVLGFLNALQPFDSYVISLWEYGQEVWQQYKYGEGEIEERASSRRRAQEILAICGQYCHPAMKELEQTLFEFGSDRGELNLGEYPELSPFGQFWGGYDFVNVWTRETKVETLEDYRYLNRCLNFTPNTSQVSHLNFVCIKYFFDVDPHQFRTGGYSFSIEGCGKQYQESMNLEMNLFNGETLTFHKDAVTLFVNLEGRNELDGTFYDGSFLITLQGAKNLILESNSDSRGLSMKFLSDLLDRCYSTAVEANLTDASIFNRTDSKRTDHFNYTDVSLAKLSNTELKLIHQNTLKDLQEIKKYYLLTWRRIDTEIKELLDNTKSCRVKLQNATPDAP